MPHCCKPKNTSLIIPRTWAVRGTTDISIDANVNKENATTYHPVDQMSLTITPRTRRVKLFFSAAGEGGTFGEFGSPNLPAPQQAVDFQLFKDGNGLIGYGTTTMITDSDTNAGAVPTPFSKSLSSWNAQIIIPIDVLPEQTTTFSIKWKTYFITDLEGPSTEVNNNPATLTNAHRSLIIEELIEG